MKKYISIFCLFLYLLLGFVSTGTIGICAGDEHSPHIGLSILGYETCCKGENEHMSPNSSKNSICSQDCNDEFFSASNNDSIITTNTKFQPLTNFIIIQPQIIAYYINDLNKKNLIKYNFKPKLKNESLVCLKTTILII